jgi:hypothetical protein
MNISIQIERLILDGVPLAHSQRRLLQAAVEAELARLVAEGGLAPTLLAGGATPHVLGGALQLTSDGDPSRLGAEIARAVYGGIG